MCIRENCWIGYYLRIIAAAALAAAGPPARSAVSNQFSFFPYAHVNHLAIRFVVLLTSRPWISPTLTGGGFTRDETSRPHA